MPERLCSHVEWLRGDHSQCNPFLADDIEALAVRADIADDMLAGLRLAVELVDRDVIRARASERDELITALTAWNAAILKATGEKP